MPSLLLLSVGVVAATYIFLLGLAFFLQHPKEPTPVVGSIPFISPLLGMLLGGGRYYVHLRDKYHLPIYTLRVPGPPIYVVNSLQTIQRIDRHISTVAFSPIQAQACKNAMAVSKSGMAKIADDKRLSDDGYLRSFSRSIAAGTSPGPGLNELSRAAVGDFAASMDRLASKGRSTVKLFDWVRHEIFAATTDATYGAHNPFRETENERAWFQYESGIMALLMGFFPSLIARRSLKARESLVSILNRYLRGNHFLEGSLFLQLRQKHDHAFGLDMDDSAHVEIGQIAAGVVNTAPSAFWMVWQVFSDAAVLADCQKEVSQLVQIGPDGVCSIDLAQVRTHCPLLVSTWQEVLRFHGISVAARIVQEDTLVDDQYFLKSGGVVLMPNAVIHSDESLWGPTARQFNHKRFLKTEKDKSHRYPVAAFRGFGGGHVLCPGRHFASTEVLALVALLLVRFDIHPIGGKWAEPAKHNAMDRAFPLLKKDVGVEMISKSDQKWHVTFSDDASGINIIAEDLE
ncbi:cytochrome P450 [Nemania abortiva]|nr:cytochrome P450 [Nemania abortiva]